MNEVWKDICFYKNTYIVSNFGDVRSLDRHVNTYHGPRICLGRQLKKHIGRDGYPRVAGTNEIMPVVMNGNINKGVMICLL